MRLTTEQINTIVTTCRAFAGEGALFWLYGSRLNDTRHGGDIDLLIEPQESINLLLRARIKTRLEQTLGLPVDVIVNKPWSSQQSLSLNCSRSSKTTGNRAMKSTTTSIRSPVASP